LRSRTTSWFDPKTKEWGTFTPCRQEHQSYEQIVHDAAATATGAPPPLTVVGPVSNHNVQDLKENMMPPVLFHRWIWKKNNMYVLLFLGRTKKRTTVGWPKSLANVNENNTWVPKDLVEGYQTLYNAG
jgi:hypothetical protein